MMRFNIGICAIMFALLVQAGCGPPPTPAASGHVAYSMSATLDGKPLPALVGIKAESYDDGYGGFTLTFTATADMEPQAIDDEIRLGLEISIEDISKIIVGKPVDVANNLDIRFLASPTAFIDPEGIFSINRGSPKTHTATYAKKAANRGFTPTFGVTFKRSNGSYPELLG